MSFSKKQRYVTVAVSAVAIAGLALGAWALIPRGATPSGDAAHPSESAPAAALNSAGADSATPDAATLEARSANDVEWVTTEPNPAAIAALESSGFTPVNEGQLTIAISAYLPPLSFLPEGSNLPAGTEPNFGSLIADALGLEYNPQVVSWADWPLGVESGKYDVITSNVTITEERKERFDFASYRQDLLGFAVAESSPIETIGEAADIEGLRIIVGSGTNQEQVLLRWNEELTAQGRTPAELVYFDDNAAGLLALRSGRVDAFFGPNATLAWQAESTGDTRLVGLVPGGWPNSAEIAVGTAKDNKLVAALEIAIDGIIADGSYEQVLTNWGLTSEAVSDSQINPPGLPAQQ